jgi:hypothetical protein
MNSECSLDKRQHPQVALCVVASCEPSSNHHIGGIRGVVVSVIAPRSHGAVDKENAAQETTPRMD